MAICRYTRVAVLVALGLLPCCGGTLSGPADAGDGVGGLTSTAGGTGSSVGGGSAMGGQKPTTGGANSAGTGGMMICCNAMPVCGNGDKEIPSQDSCPSGAECYSTSICCTTIWCEKPTFADECDPTTEYNRKYSATSAASCQVVKFTCPANTTAFFNSCGCGCEQDASCPQYVDCMPGPGTSDPLCANDGKCPYTTRAM